MFTATVSALGAIAGVIIGSIVSFLIARLQFRGTVISANRQQWINMLRDSIADFQARAKIVTTETNLALNEATSIAADDKTHYDALKAMNLYINKIKLLINPNEQDHVQLVTLLMELNHLCVNGDTNDFITYNKLQDSITHVGQIILKREWERVKLGK